MLVVIAYVSRSPFDLAGHEFLDASREDTIWNQAKAMIAKVGGATWPVWINLLTRLIQKKVDLLEPVITIVSYGEAYQ